MWTVTTAFSNVTTLSDIRLDIWLSTLHQSALLLKKSDHINKVSAQPISLCILHLFCSTGQSVQYLKYNEGRQQTEENLMEVK